MIEDGLEHNRSISRQALAALHEAGFAWALSLTAYDDQAAEDVMQQTYVALLEGSARYDERSSLKTWLFAVIRNCARQHIRRQRQERSGLARLARSLPADDPGTAANVPQDAPSSVVRQAIRGLPARQREVLELVIDAEFTLEQAARVLGISTGSARTHYHRAKQALRRQLEEDHERRHNGD